MNSPVKDLETQIEVFLEQVKQSAVRAMEELPSDVWLINEKTHVKRSRSDISSSDDGTLHSAVSNQTSMDVTDDKATEEVMNCLLAMSKLQNVQQDNQYWQNYQEGEPAIIWKFGNDTNVQQTFGYKIEKLVLAENVGQENGATGENQIVLIQNVGNETVSASYAELNTSSHYEPVLENINEPLNISEPRPGSSKTESSYSESIDIDVEDSDTPEIFHSSEPVSPAKTTRVRKILPTKRTRTKKKESSNKAAKQSPKKAVKAKEVNTVTNESEIDNASYNVLTTLEDNAGQVAERFALGCECETNCYDGFSAEKVFRHRLNIADLTKAEHDMYLMGVIHASMQNPEETCKKKERLRIRTTYAYYGKRVCLTAFLYLEHVTLYQMKRIRKHLQNHGVSPRIHGNHGRKPSNTLPLDIYQHATYFVQNFIQQHHIKGVNDSSKTKSKNIFRLPADYTKKTLHEEYRRYCQKVMPTAKIMQYSTFTNFFKKQFPNVKFRKVDKVEKRCDDHQESADDKSRRIRKKGKIAMIAPTPADDVPTDVAVEVEVGAGSNYRSYVILDSTGEVLEDGATLIIKEEDTLTTQFINGDIKNR